MLDRLNLRWFASDLNLRGDLVANALSESIADAFNDPRAGRLQALFNRAMQDERLVAMGLCRGDTPALVAQSSNFPKDLDCVKARSLAALAEPQLRIEGGPVHVTVHRVTADIGSVGELVLLPDLSFIERRSHDTRQYLIVFIALLGAAIALPRATTNAAS